MNLFLLLTGSFLLVALIGYLIGRWDKNHADYYRGYRDGEREERSYRNAMMIPRVMDAFKKGRIVERAKGFWASRN